jgi:hypothetical protein
LKKAVWTAVMKVQISENEASIDKSHEGAIAVLRREER